MELNTAKTVAVIQNTNVVVTTATRKSIVPCRSARTFYVLNYCTLGEVSGSLYTTENYIITVLFLSYQKHDKFYVLPFLIYIYTVCTICI